MRIRAVPFRVSLHHERDTTNFNFVSCIFRLSGHNNNEQKRQLYMACSLVRNRSIRISVLGEISFHMALKVLV